MSQLLPWGIAANAGGGGGGGSATSVTGINRNVGSDAGGATVVITGTGFSGLLASDIQLGSAQVVTLSSFTSTTATIVVPALPGGAILGGSVVNITVAGQTLNSSFLYQPGITQTQFATVTTGFEGAASPPNDILPFTTFGTAVASTDQAFEGSKSAKVTFTASGQTVSLSYDFGAHNYPAAAANGLFIHFYLYISSAAKSSMAAGQTKLQRALIYDSGGNNVIGGWLVMGIGPNIPGSPGNTKLQACVDQVGNNPLVGSAYTYLVDGWNEIAMWHWRDTNAHKGYAEVYYGNGGGLTYAGILGHVNLGTDGLTDRSKLTIVEYSELGNTYPLTYYVDKVTFADGWIDP